MALVLRPPTGTESLTETLGDLGRTRKLVAATAGVFAFAAATAGAALVACLLDAAVSLPPLARALALGGTLALAGVVWLRGVSRSLTLRSDPLSVALELEEKYPDLNDALASAISFLESEDASGRGVSPHLERAAVRSAHRAANRYNLDRLVPSGRCWRAVWACAAVAAAAVPLAVASPERAAVAVVRLADPFGNHPWHTRTRVEVVAPAELPARMPKGEAFDLKFVVRGVVKDRAVVTFRFNNGEEFEEQYPLAGGNDPKFPGAAVVAARIEAARVQSPFAFKLASNDFESEWLRVDVVPPPRLVPLPGPGGGRPSPRFHVRPPAYTGLPELDLPDGASVLEVPVGTVVTVNATADVRLAAAALAFTGDRTVVGQAAGLAGVGHLNALAAVGAEALANEIGSDIPLTIDSAGRGLSATFAPSMSGMYAFRLTDETGLIGTRLLEIRLLPDPSPTVVLIRPSLGKDPQVLTPAASLAVHVAADDKVYAVRRTFLEYRVGRDGPVRVVPLLDAGSFGRELVAVAGGPAALARVRPTTTEATKSVPLASLTRDGTNPLRDGDSVFVRGAADDWDDVTPAKEPGRSPEFEIRVATAETVEAWLERELAAMRPDLIRVRNQQREARQKAGEVVPHADGSLAPADRDRLLAAEQTQRLLRGKISDPSDGMRAKADVLLETVRVNALPRSNTTDRVAVVAEALGRLSDRDLPVIEPTLTEARQVGGQPARPGQAGVVPDMLRKAARHQKTVEDGLTDLLDLLAVWGGAVEIRGEARVLRDFVQRQREEVEKLGPAPAAGDLDRAGTRAEQASEQANQLLTRAGRLAAEKDREAARHRTAGREKQEEAAALREQAAELPPGTPEKSAAGARATLLEAEAEESKAAAEKALAEAGALRKAVAATDGQSLPEGLRDAAGKVRKDNRLLAADQLLAAVGRLDRMIEALSERGPEAAPDLAKRKRAADNLDALATAQDDIRRRSAEAARIADPAARSAELKRLAAEQDKLIERGKDLLQRLTLERAERPARDVRAAVDSMEAARGDLEGGNPGIRPQNDAVDRLDAARDRLDAAAASAPQQLSDEKRRKMAEKLQAVLDRQKAAVAEAERVHTLVAAAKEWTRDALTAYGDLAEKRQQPIADDLRPVEKDFAPLPVLARVVADATGAMDRAAKQITGRLEDADPALAFDPVLEAENDRKVLRPMRLAQRRLEQLIEALKQDDPKPMHRTDPPPANPAGQPPPAGGSGDQDLVPPQAQLKVLRSLQAELNERTAEFAKAHPDAAKLTDDERAELKQLEDAQREMAALFEQIAKSFHDAKQADPEPQPKPDKADKAAAPQTEKP